MSAISKGFFIRDILSDVIVSTCCGQEKLSVQSGVKDCEESLSLDSGVKEEPEYIDSTILRHSESFEYFMVAVVYTFE